MKDDEPWKLVIKQAEAENVPVQLHLQDNDGNWMWLLVDPTTKSFSESATPWPGVRSWPPEDAN